MRNPLNKRIPREIKSNLGKYISIFLLFSLTIMLGSAIFDTGDSAKYTIEYNQENNKREDGYLQSFSKIEQEVIDSIENSNNVEMYENFYTDVDYNKNNSTIRIYTDQNNIDLPELFEGKLPDEENEIALERLYAYNNNININDTLEINDKKMIVTGIISLPNYTSLFKNNSAIIMDTCHFGVAIVNEKAFEKIASNKVVYNYSYYFENRNLSEDEKKEENKELRKKLSEKITLSNFVSAKDNQAISFFIDDIGKDIPMMRALMFIIIIIISFSFAVLIRSTIEQESVIIGTLRANGYSKREILIHYMNIPILMAVIGGAVGNIVGYTAMLKPFKDIYYTCYSIPPFIIRWNSEVFLFTTIVPILIIAVINYISLAKKLSLTPLQFLRKDLKKHKNKKTMNLPNFSFINRFRLRVIFQNKGIYVVLLIGMFLASFLLMFGVGLMSIFTNYVDKADETLISEYQYILKMPIEIENGEKLVISNYETYYKNGKNNVDVTFYGIIENTEYFNKSNLKDKKDGIVISDGFAKKLNYKVGDTIVFEDPYFSKKYELKVAEIVEYNVNYAVFMKQKDLNELLDKPENYFNSYVSNEKLEINEEVIAKIITREDVTKLADQMMEFFKEILILIDIFSIIIYLVIMYILTKVVIEKNKNNISLLKIFGYTNKESKKIYLKVTSYVVIASLILSIPFEIMLFKVIMEYALVMIDSYIEFYLPLYIYAEIVLIGILSYFVINFLHVKKIDKIEMNDALKNRE